jgi:DNA repair protein RecN (Recombination protein N)
MLTRLAVSNYALINKLTVDFTAGLNSVTGETGAGKSIILGALGLILGNRADLSVLKNQDEKCIVEGIFEVGSYNLESFFSENDLDFDNSTILRREILPSGKSRAFINDTPVNLNVLRDLSLQLIDIHSQHQNLELGNRKFQLDLVDTVSGAGKVHAEYYRLYSRYTGLQKRLEDLRAKNEKEKADLDYWQFQFAQLDEALLQENEQVELETELEQLTHAEEIKSALAGVQQLLDDDRFSVVGNLKESSRRLENIQKYVPGAQDMARRLQSCLLEVKDILEEADVLAEKTEYNPGRIELVNDRLALIYSLQQKHHVATLGELISLKDSFGQKIDHVSGFEAEIQAMENELEETRTILENTSQELTDVRKKSFEIIEKAVVNDLMQLGMPKSKLEVLHEPLPAYTPSGKDSVSFLFSANASTLPAEISKIASGGEMSRLMLAIKNLLRTSKALPTVIFDEIDSGISGEIALRMGTMLKVFSASAQIINITHLPQIAAKGDAHFMVYKYEQNGNTYTSVRRLEEQERVEELAKMVGGENLTDSTLKTARELLDI